MKTEQIANSRQNQLRMLRPQVAARFLLVASLHCGSSLALAIAPRGAVLPRMAASVAIIAADELPRAVASTAVKVEQAAALLDLAAHELRARELEGLSSAPAFWDDAPSAEAALRELNTHRDVLARIGGWRAAVADAQASLELARELEASDGAAELLAEAGASVAALGGELDAWEVRSLMSGEHDARGATVTITSGSGGVDAQDWAAMLLRMYQRWGERAGYSVKLVERSDAEEAGIRSATLALEVRM